jgi:hypothetical protein
MCEITEVRVEIRLARSGRVKPSTNAKLGSNIVEKYDERKVCTFLF